MLPKISVSYAKTRSYILMVGFVRSSVVFTDPQIAAVGLTQAQAEQRGHRVKISVLPLPAVPRAQVNLEDEGVVVLLADEDNDRLLSVQMVAAKFFRGLTDLTRLRILEILLEEGDKNVSELVEALGLAQGHVSSHLACLRWCGFVTSRREGRYVYYSVGDERAPQLIELARGIIAENALSILTCVRM